MERWHPSRDSGCVPRQQRASWRRHWRAARSRTPTASSTRPSTAARRASARTRRVSPGRRSSLRVPAVVQADGRIVVAGQRAGAATLARFNANGTLDTTYGTGGFVSARFAGTPTSQPGASAATALALDPSGDVLATGFGASQSMFVARFSPARRHDCERRLLRTAPDRLHGLRDRRAPRRQRRDRGLGARPLARHALQVLRRARGRAGDRRIVQHERLRLLERLGGDGQAARLLRRRRRRPRARRHAAERRPGRPDLPRRRSARRTAPS